MTTVTFNALSNSSHRVLPSFKLPNFVERRAALPDMDEAGTPLSRATDALSHAVIAAVPFAALFWLFVAR